MNTAQMTQTMPRVVNDVQPPAPAQPSAPAPTMQPEVVKDLPVQNPNASTPTGFSPIMSSEHTAPHAHSLPQPAAAHSQPKAENKPDQIKPKSEAGRKPIVQTILLIIACVIACVVVYLMFSSQSFSVVQQ
jgi:hypothetical protein